MPSEVKPQDMCDYDNIDADAFPFWYLGAATCGEGGYMAMDQQPNNPNVAGLFSEGMVNAIEIHPDSPPDVLT